LSATTLLPPLELELEACIDFDLAQLAIIFEYLIGVEYF
jgi:hypothetical protein